MSRRMFVWILGAVSLCVLQPGFRAWHSHRNTPPFELRIRVSDEEGALIPNATLQFLEADTKRAAFPRVQEVWDPEYVGQLASQNGEIRVTGMGWASVVSGYSVGPWVLYRQHSGLYLLRLSASHYDSRTVSLSDLLEGRDDSNTVTVRLHAAGAESHSRGTGRG